MGNPGASNQHGAMAARAAFKRLFRHGSALVFGLLFCLLAAPAQSAYLITSDSDAELNWDGSALSARASTVVTRFEQLGFYRYNPDATESFTVWPGHFANTDSLSGTTPAITAPLPSPLDEQGQPLTLGQPVPLEPANTFEAGEPVFIVFEQLLLNDSALGTRPDGRRFLALTVAVEDADGNVDSHTITLVQDSLTGTRYIGYLQPSAAIAIPDNSDIRMIYDDYGEIPDSQAAQPPALVDAGRLTQLNERKLARVGAANGAVDTDLFLSKEASRANVTTGDFLAWRLRLENTGTATATNLSVEDRLPRGFRYQPGSLRVDGAPVADPAIDGSGRGMQIPLADLPVGAVTEIRYVTEVTAVTDPGEATNIATAESASEVSNEATARTIVERAFFNDRAFLIGRVIAGECGERDATGVEGIRLYLDDGTNVVTDEHGRWHIEGVRPGTRVLQVDHETLGERYILRPCEDTSRAAGNPASRFLNLQGGTLWRENFYLEEIPPAEAAMQLELLTESTGEAGVYNVSILLTGGQARLEDIVAEIRLDDALDLREDQVLLDDGPFSAITAREDHYELQLGEQAPEQARQLTLPVALRAQADTQEEKIISVGVRGRLPNGELVELESENAVAMTPEETDRRTIVIRPRFGSLSAELTAADRANLDDAVRQLREFEDLHLSVTGHTDNVPIRPRPGRAINDNYALGLARAESVAAYLAEQLELDPADVEVHSAGPDDPVADNETPEGRARNRRVEINASVSVKVRDAQYHVTRNQGVAGGTTVTPEEEENTLPADFRGMANIDDGMSIARPVISVNALLDSGLSPRLLLNGEPVPEDRIGMKAVNEATGATRYVWVGVQFFREGEHELELQGLDPFGNVRFSETHRIIHTGAIQRIRKAAEEQPENTADGRTPVRLRLDLRDASGRPITAGTELRLVESGGLQPLRRNNTDNPLEQDPHVVEVDSDGYAWFEPVSDAGTYRIRLASGETTSDMIEVPVDPHLRDWILVGFAEGTAGYNQLKDNQAELGDQDEHFFTDGEISFFARGRVKGEWLLTAAYNSQSRDDESPLSQAIDPEQWYVLYGDNTFRRHDAPSSERLYVRMERRDFYMLYGDFNTDMTVTELSRYNRVLTGAKTEYRGRNVSATGFASETEQAFLRDEIPGDGTSGLYRLSRRDIIPGSEQVTIEVRDRFTNELISSQSRTRFIDYSIDYRSGEIFFRQPVPVQDEAFNPITIVVEYETENGENDFLGGGRVALHDQSKQIELGLSAVHDDTTGASGTLGGLDFRWEPDEHHTIRAEMARTRQDVNMAQDRETDNAWLTEHRYTSEKLDTRIHMREQAGGFGLGQQSTTQDARRTTGGEARYRVTEQWRLAAEASRQELLDNDNQRDIVETRAEYEGVGNGFFSGLRHARDVSGNRTLQSDQVIAGAHQMFLDERLRLSIRGETNVNETNHNTDFPSRLGLGADYRLTSRVNLFSAQEFSWNDERRTSDTRLGLRATPWTGGTLSSELRQTRDEYGPRLFAHSGLHQTLDLGGGWSTDFGLDRAQTVRDSDAEEDSFDSDRAPASGGAPSSDYTAAFAGLGYQTSEWQFTSRAEVRDADLDQRVNLLAGFHHQRDNADTLAGRILHFYSSSETGERREETSLEGSYARRPFDADWSVLNRTRLTFDSLEDDFGEQRGSRVTNNTVANYDPANRHQVSLQYGARYVVETIDDERFRGYTDLMGLEYRFDIVPRWDIGTRASQLHSWNSDVRKTSFGLMAGFSPARDIWISLGYNFRGFYDDDFDGASGRMQGVVVDFRIKFDQDSVRRAREHFQ